MSHADVTVAPSIEGQIQWMLTLNKFMNKRIHLQCTSMSKTRMLLNIFTPTKTYCEHKDDILLNQCHYCWMKPQLWCSYCSFQLTPLFINILNCLTNSSFRIIWFKILTIDGYLIIHNIIAEDKTMIILWIKIRKMYFFSFLDALQKTLYVQKQCFFLHLLHFKHIAEEN